MNLFFEHKRISGILTVVPGNEVNFVDELSNYHFPPARSMKLKEVMGYDKRRIVAGPVCSSDLACCGLESLFERDVLNPDEIDALVVVTQTPDYLMPGTASVIQGRLGLKQDMFCVDLNQGCAGFVTGLCQAFMMLEQPAIRKAVLVNVDVLSRKVSPQDRNSYPLIGDAASITVLERCEESAPIYGNLKMDGARHAALMIPAGGLRQPCTSATAVMEDDGENNRRAQDHLRMDGSAVFNFVQTEVPKLIHDLLTDAGVPRESVDHFLFHQPNRFMLQKLAQAMKVDPAKIPSDVVEIYGNSSGATIPVAITHHLGESLKRTNISACLAGFGVGLTWASMLMRLGPLQFCEMIEFDGGVV